MRVNWTELIVMLAIIAVRTIAIIFLIVSA